ncbi:helix-turn-helix transcriptional regulator [Nocardia brasiliensis]|uniref:helix-turn-helix transcriptional regulator n=1 Tax=Nocardia brasiliensis TaxID=37326 RepID=UPI0004A75B7C|nr:helix-turn-helix transcriptional regulator [Nocardia brasiliensis]
MNQRLQAAMLRAGLGSGELAAAVGVDAKTVNRWLAGRIPHRSTRVRIAELLHETEETLWPPARPDLQAGAPATAEVIAAYAHRAEIPNDLWTSLVHKATERIDIMGYAYPFVFELLPTASKVIAAKCRAGCVVRLGFADPDCDHVIERDTLEQMGGTLPGRIRNALSMLGPLGDTPGCSIGLHTSHLYNSVFRFDDQMIVTPYLFRARGYQHTALHLRRLSPYGIFESFADQFEQIWGTVTPYSTTQGFANGLTA